MQKAIIDPETIRSLRDTLKTGNMEPLDRYLQWLWEHRSSIQACDDDALLPLASLAADLLTASQTHFRQLVDTVGVRLLLAATKDRMLIMEDLASLYRDENYIADIYTRLKQYKDTISRLYYCHPMLFHEPEQCVRSRGMLRAWEAILDAGFYCGCSFDQSDAELIIYAALSKDTAYARAYANAKRKYFDLCFDNTDGYSVLSYVVDADNRKLMQICLDNGACVNTPHPCGLSLLDAARSEEMRKLILRHGGKPTQHGQWLLHQTVASLSPTVVNAEHLDNLLKLHRSNYRHSYRNSFSDDCREQCTDLYLAAARQGNIAVLKQLIPDFLQDHTNAQLKELLLELFSNHFPERTSTPPIGDVIDFMRLLVREGVRVLTLCNEDYRNMRENYQHLWIINLLKHAYIQYGHWSTPEQYLELVSLLWTVLGGSALPAGLQRLLHSIFSKNAPALTDDCLTFPGVDSSLLDTDDNSAVYMVLTQNRNASPEKCLRDVIFALAHGAKVNHVTRLGSVLDLVRKDNLPDYMTDLLRSLGACTCEGMD